MAPKEASEGKKNVETDYRTPGLRRAQTTTLFRAVNPELFIKPVRDVLHRTVLPFSVLYFRPKKALPQGQQRVFLALL